MSTSILERRNSSYLQIPTMAIDIQKRIDKRGTSYLSSRIALEEYPFRITERLEHWASKIPDTVFLAKRDKNNNWMALTYKETWEKVQWIWMLWSSTKLLLPNLWHVRGNWDYRMMTQE